MQDGRGRHGGIDRRQQFREFQVAQEKRIVAEHQTQHAELAGAPEPVFANVAANGGLDVVHAGARLLQELGGQNAANQHKADVAERIGCLLEPAFVLTAIENEHHGFLSPGFLGRAGNARSNISSVTGTPNSSRYDSR